MKDEFDIDIFKKLIEINFEHSKLRNSADSDCFNSLQQVRILSNQFLSFYKVAFVEGGVNRFDIVIASVLSSFVNLVKEYTKNIENSQSKIISMNHIVETMERLLLFLVKEKSRVLNLG